MARSQCRFDHPPFLRDAAPLPFCPYRGIFVSRNDCSLLGSVHLHPKWTPIRRVHFARMTLIYKDVETVTTGHNRTLTVIRKLATNGLRGDQWMIS